MTESFQKVSLNVHLAGRMYPLMVQESQQELVRIIARELNERIGQLQLQEDPNKDKQDCIAIAAMSWALDFAIARQSELSAAREIMAELTTENQKFAEQNAANTVALKAINTKLAAHEADNATWKKQLNTLHTILDTVLQK
jgi:cell division protein ZapA (FtsZ GTPase activity inhibitor)